MKKTNFKKRITRSKKKVFKKVDNRVGVDIKSTMKTVETGINKHGVFIFTKTLTPDKFAIKLMKTPNEIIKYFFMKGQIVTLNNILTQEQMGEYCLECDYDFKWEEEVTEKNVLEKIHTQFESMNLEKRTPIITIMGHVDHGKTTLLDSIKKTKFVDREVGGITQHIGAYTIGEGESMITLIDTPGHEAFTQMRKRGANVTDIVVIVVAADDGVMPQTKEAIDHAKAAKTPIMVFINKMDKPGANPEKVMGQLSDLGVVAEEWGGEIIFIKGSAITGEGIEDLKNAILLIADVLDLKAAKNAFSTGTTIESYMSKGLGPVANILVQNGTLNLGDFLIIGSCYGKIRTMVNDLGISIKSCGPSTPVSISGLNGNPNAGDKFLVTKDEKTAKSIANRRLNPINQKINRSLLESQGTKVLNIIIKSDVNGSLQAIAALLDKITIEGSVLNIVRAATGYITESDISLAKVTNSIVFGFNSMPDNKTSSFARSEDVTIKFHNIIYNLKDEVEAIMYGILDPIFEEKIIGHAQVRQVWEHSAVGKIAGCIVLDGEVQRNAFVTVRRKDEVLVEKSRISSLKQEKNTVTKVSSGKECGLTIENFKDLKVDDLIEVFLLVKKETVKK